MIFNGIITPKNMAKRETLKSVYNLLKWTETFQNKNLKEIRSILDRYDDKVIWLSRKKM